MPQPRQPKPSNRPLSKNNREHKTVSNPDQVATLNLAPEALSHLRRLCTDERQEGKAAEKTLVDIRMNKNRASRVVAVSGENPLDRGSETLPIRPRQNDLSAGVTIVATSTQTSSRRRNAADTPFGDGDKTVLKRRNERPDTCTADRFSPLERIVRLWRSYRIGILIGICSVFALMRFLDPPISNSTLKRPASASPEKASKRVEQPTPKPHNAAEITSKGKTSNAQRATLLQKDLRNPPLVTEKHSSASADSPTPSERIAVDLLIAGRLRAAHRRYCELALQRRDRPVHRVIARALSQQLSKGRSQHPRSGDDSCRIPEAE